MDIGIIGGGSIGLLFAYYLNQSASVTLYTRTAEQAEKLNRDGLYLKNHKQVLHHTRLKAKPFDSWQGKEELMIVTVKQYHLAPVLEKIQNQADHGSRLLFLQNGMGHIKPLKTLSNRHLYVGSVEHGSYRNDANHVYHNGVGVTRMATYSGDKTFLEGFISYGLINFPFVVEDNYYEMLINKLIVNSMINPLTAVLQVENGKLIENPHYFSVFKSIFEEIRLILGLEDHERYFTHVLTICEKTAQNRSSMLKDLDRQQETEIDAILGYLLEEAEIKGLEAPIIHMLYHLIKGKSIYGGAK